MESESNSMIPRRQFGTVPLPKGAWAEWGKDAVYFVTLTQGLEEDDGPGFNFYAINTNDETLPVYHITRFTFDGVGIKRSWVASGTAVMGSRAYVIAEESMWSFDFGGDNEPSSEMWIKGRAPSPPLFSMPHPQLFSMRGNLYALGYTLPSDGNSFQLLLDGEFWTHLDPPPGPFPDEEELWEATRSSYLPIGMSCIDDSKLILHVPTPEQARKPVVRLVNISGENHFLVFEFKGDSIMRGEWTRLRIKPYDSWGCDPCPRAPHPHRSYFPAYHSLLGAASPLLLPLLPGKLFAFGGFGHSDSAAIHLEFPQEVHIEWPPSSKSFFDFESRLNTAKTWHVIHLGGSRYCVIAFPPLQIVRNGLFVFTFDLVIRPPPGKDDTDTASCSAPSSACKFAAVSVHSNYRCRRDGGSRPFLSGKASTSTK